MTALLNAEFTDETGTVRKLRRDELLLYLTVIATAAVRGWASMPTFVSTANGQL